MEYNRLAQNKFWDGHIKRSFNKKRRKIMAKITEDMLIYEVLQLAPDIGPVFFEFGMHCLGCPVSRGETVAQAAAAHGVDVQEMLDKLNEFAEAHA